MGMKSKRFWVSVIVAVVVIVCALLMDAAVDFIMFVADLIPFGRLIIIGLAFCALVYFVDRWLKIMNK